MRILITGGNGFVGQAVARQFVRDGHDVLLGSRRGSVRGALPEVSALALDVTDRTSVRQAMSTARPEVVVHLVGIIAQRGTQTFEQVHVQGTRNLLEACAPQTRFLHMSALGARADSASGYSRSKSEAESLVRASGLPFTIFQPSLIFGPGDDFFARVLKNLVSSAPIVPVIGSGAFPFRPVSVHDVALAFSRALQRPTSVSQTYQLTGPQEFRFDDLLKLELQALGQRKPLLYVPLGVMNLAVPLMQILPRPPITRDQYRMLLEGNTADPEPARTAFDLPMLELREALPGILRGAGAKS
ncbi:complex I NDUFA9 subunit family protein [Deinococcus peraridilitoris]|uniref:Nucleoside-diphosphate-sugar epimerase n=1 Tax=Deinococcus peraridilitoris (strain DSM 19664 / LMG 22246 / CIP 109416 / KR-200) TaxID=937777 RepID=L0A608_DEIPD|nr:complex I NDUFA9 subunit family protein [Deinococcus peraridilitoris]AFZ68587.1 nucleoside-diphosphate-sugar epimerase [Deinococcus peraridilitoris DSM 19664]